MARWMLAACIALLTVGSVLAQPATDAAELEFWRSIQNSTNPAEYRAYLEAFPNGRFAPLARVRAGLAKPDAPAAPPAVAPKGFDGRWKGEIWSDGGSPVCGGLRFSGLLVVQGGRASGYLSHGYAGQMMLRGGVSPTGELTDAFAAGGVEEVILLAGRFDATTAAGTWESRSYGCLGKWSAKRME